MRRLSDAIAAIDLKAINEQTIDYDAIQGILGLFVTANEDLR